MKICVYAIARNESKFVDRFCDAAAPADYIAVLDTGSTDDTVEKLKARGCIVERIGMDPFRFDEARNESMKLIPADTDVCVNVDLDEVLCDGWREKLEAAWQPGMLSAMYTCVSSRSANGEPGTTFLREKIHAPGVCSWIYPVHEVLQFTRPRPRIEIPEIYVDHLPDPNKSRAQYLDLLELAAKERPDDARCAHYLGREYMYRRKFQKSIDELRRHLSLPSAVWDDERSASCRYIAEDYIALHDYASARQAAMQAIIEQPKMRENWYEAEKVAYFEQDWIQCRFYGERAVKITERSQTTINEAEAWGPNVHDYLAIAYYRLKCRPELALEQGRKALEYDPDNERLQRNLDYYIKAYDESRK